MNLNLCALALLLFGCLAAGVQGRAVDLVDESNDVDNSIEESPSQSKHHTRPYEEDWLKFIMAPPAKLEQAAGATVEIVCDIMGSKVPSVQWIVGHMPLSEIDGMDSNTVSEDESTAIVRVRSVHVIDHMLSEPRVYTCVGRTGSKTIYASTLVHPSHSDSSLGDMIVPEKQYNVPQKPRIIYTEKTHLEVIGSNVMLPCKVHARPHAKITWRNNRDKEIVQSHRYKVLPSGDLLISDLKWEDMGNFKCIAHNAVGRDSAETFVYPVRKEED